MGIPGYNDADWKAAATAEGSFTPTQLFTAEDEIKTKPGLFLTGQGLLDVGLIVAYNAADKLVPWDPTATVAVVGGAVDQTAPAPQAKPAGIVATAINTTSPAGDRHGEIYVGGCFNPDLLIWPAALDTYLERAAALDKAGAPFRVKRLL